MKKACKIIAAALAAAGYFYLMQIETPCEANPKMAMNGYCDVETQEEN